MDRTDPGNPAVNGAPSRLWVDVSSTLSWGRPAVGTIRVEASCIRAALAEPPAGIRFCRYDGRGGFAEVATDAVRQALDRIGPPQPVPVSRAKRWLNRLPAPVVAWLLRALLPYRPVQQSISAGLADLKRAWRLARSPAASGNAPSGQPATATRLPAATRAPDPMPAAPLPPVSPADFQPGDVYLCVGSDWNHGNLDYLRTVKQRHGLRTVLFCHDIIPILLPQLCIPSIAAAFPSYIANLAWSADAIVCNSANTRSDLQNFLQQVGAPVPTLSVVPLGTNAPPQDAGWSGRFPSLTGRRYILHVSTIERRKNHDTVYRAYARLVDEGVSDLPVLVLVGMEGWRVGGLLRDIAEDPRVRDLIQIYSHVDDAQLWELYRHALFTVYPSLYEGWGLPVAESLAAGKFCLTAGVASLPEVGGDLVEYLDPWDTPGWAARLRWYFEHPEALREREQRIVREYRAVPWSETAAGILTAVRAQQSEAAA